MLKNIKQFMLAILLVSTGIYLAACSSGGGSSAKAPTETESLQSATITGTLVAESSTLSKLMDIMGPASAVANVPATLFIDDSPTPFFLDGQDHFTIVNIQEGDHSLFIRLDGDTKIELPFRMVAGRGLDFGIVTLLNGQVDDFTGFNGYHFGWIDDDGDGINDNFVDADGDGICDRGYRFAGYAYYMDQGYVDSNNDGLNDHFADANGDGINDLTGYPYGFGFSYIDEDGDGINDRFADADGDGICDLSAMPYRHPFGWLDEDGNGINDLFTDSNGDGINDVIGMHYVAMPGWVDLDEDGMNDFFADADGDGVNDLSDLIMPYGHGLGWVDENSDGINDNFVDADGDGINDYFDGPYADMNYGYGFNTPHLDADGNGIDDVSGMSYFQGFGWIDTDGDGVNDAFADSDGDGINDLTGYHYDIGYMHDLAHSQGDHMVGSIDWPNGFMSGGGMMQ